jgi:hypothetical protein
VSSITRNGSRGLRRQRLGHPCPSTPTIWEDKIVERHGPTELRVGGSTPTAAHCPFEWPSIHAHADGLRNPGRTVHLNRAVEAGRQRTSWTRGSTLSSRRRHTPGTPVPSGQLRLNRCRTRGRWADDRIVLDRCSFGCRVRLGVDAVEQLVAMAVEGSQFGEVGIAKQNHEIPV